MPPSLLAGRGRCCATPIPWAQPWALPRAATTWRQRPRRWQPCGRARGSCWKSRSRALCGAAFGTQRVGGAAESRGVAARCCNFVRAPEAAQQKAGWGVQLWQRCSTGPWRRARAISCIPDVDVAARQPASTNAAFSQRRPSLPLVWCSQPDKRHPGGWHACHAARICGAGRAGRR